MTRFLLLLGALAIASVATASGLSAPPTDLDGPAWPLVLLSIAMLAGSALFSGTETALFSLQPIDRRSLPEKGRSQVEELLGRPRRTLASLLIGNEIINVSLGTVTASLLFTLVPDKPWLNVIVVTPLLVVFGEVTPKVLAFRFNRRVAVLAAPLVRGWSKAVAPIRFLLAKVAELALRLVGGSAAPNAAAMREQQLRALIDQGREQGSIRPMEQEMIHRVFEFGELPVHRLMTPRPDMVMLSLTTPWDDLVEAVRLSGLSRLPVWQGSPDDVIGVLLAKDLLPLRLEVEQGLRPPPTPRDVRKRLRSAHFVPTTKRADHLLAEFRAEKFHIALVVDEHGSIAGLVTLDDLLAELVGEMLDENDDLEAEVEALGADTYTVRAWMDIDDFAERFHVEVPAGDYTTLGGFLLSLAGEVPDKGDELSWGGFEFTVSGIERRRITEVCVKVAPGTKVESIPGEPADGAVEAVSEPADDPLVRGA